MGLSPYVSTKTQMLRTSTWQQDYGMVKIQSMLQKIPLKQLYEIQNGQVEKLISLKMNMVKNRK